MPTFRSNRSDDLVLKDGNIGINSSSPTVKLDVVGDVKGINANVTGVATFSSYSGYLKSNQNIIDNRVIKDSSSTLSGEIIVGSGKTLTVSESSEVGQGNILSLKVSNIFTPPIGGTNDRPSAPQPGSLFYNKDFRTIEYWDGNYWRQVDNTTRSGRAVFGGASADSNYIHYFNTATQGNSNNFGSLTSAKSEMNGMSDGTRGLFANGYSSPGGRLNTIEYITIASEGNGIDFGDSTMRRNSGDSGCSSSTRGVMAGGYTHGNSPANDQNVIDYVEIQTVGNAVDFGDLAYAHWGLGACSSPTRGLWGGGGSGPNVAGAHEEITMITIASKGNSVDFGKLTQGRYYGGASGNSVRGIWAGGYVAPSTTGQKTIDYVTIASTGNAIDFGERTVGGSYGCATANSTRYFMIGGRDTSNTSTGYNIIEYVNIASTGDAIDFGDITWNARYNAIGALSDSHGGLGGF